MDNTRYVPASQCLQQMAVLHKLRYTSSSNFGASAANSLNISSDSEIERSII